MEKLFNVKETMKKLKEGTIDVTSLSYSEKRNLLKKNEYNRLGNQVVKTGHKTFDKQTNMITTGNVIANTQLSGFIRKHSEVECNGYDFKEGELRKSDLKDFRKFDGFQMVKDYLDKSLKDEQVILYAFAHRSSKDRIIVHGYVITTSDYVYINDFVVGPTSKSYDIVQEMKKYISIEI